MNKKAFGAMSLRPFARRKNPYQDEVCEDEGFVERDGQEKTIPFLRRLADMLIENDDVISFNPGSCNNDQKVLGKIIVHDRARVESEILPKYFNHASFASLRRQLNYFSFTRLGKGRQRGATYCNEGVVELNDILYLKRRSTAAAPAVSIDEDFAIVEPSETTVRSDQRDQCIAKVGCLVPVVHLPPPKRRRWSSGQRPATSSKKSRKPLDSELTPSIISPLSASPVTSDEEDERNLRVILDLTVPATRHELCYRAATATWHFGTKAMTKDEDVMAGCNALLSFSNRPSRA